MNRRGFFGMAAGAVAAGPKVAADMASQVSLGVLPRAMMAFPTSGGVESSGASNIQWATNRLHKLRNSSKEQREISLRQRADTATAEINSFRSVAGWKRQAMQARAIMDMQEQTEERNLLGIIAGLWE